MLRNSLLKQSIPTKIKKQFSGDLTSSLQIKTNTNASSNKSVYETKAYLMNSSSIRRIIETQGSRSKIIPIRRAVRYLLS